MPFFSFGCLAFRLQIVYNIRQGTSKLVFNQMKREKDYAASGVQDEVVQGVLRRI